MMEYDATAAHVAEHAPRARLLEHLTAEVGAEVHRVWLDGGDVLHAWAQDPAAPSGAWTLEREPAGQALEWIRDTLRGVLSRVTDPSLYAAESASRPAKDEEVLADLFDVEVAALADREPRTADSILRWRIEIARAHIGILADLRAHYIATRFGGGRGWQTAAADALGISPAAVTTLLQGRQARADRRRDDARQAREQAD